ncbi:hypothetical protein JCM8208_000832 [Rhodotorula glutinis]
MLLPLSCAHRCAPTRHDRPYLALVVVACVALLVYLEPRRALAPSTDTPTATGLDLVLAPNSTSSSSPITASSLAHLALPRFAALVSRPILDYDSSLALESLRCPATHLQTNRDQLRNDGEGFWTQVTVDELLGARDRVVERVKARFGWGGLEGEMRSDAEVDEMLGKGRGLVFTAGNKDTTSRLLTSLRILRRHHHCTLPVEIFCFPTELAALEGTKLKREIDELEGVTWREIEAEWVEGAWKQFGIKGDALARTSFAEFLYLDSDNVPLVDPAFLFDSPTYRAHGAVLWPDFNRDSAANPIWRLVSHPCSPAGAWQAESGQVLVNKRAHEGLDLVVLEVARAMMRDEGFWFRLSGGDKDLFRYAFLFLSLPFGMAPHYPSALGGPLLPPLAPHTEGHTFCGHSMVQYGLDATREWALLRRRGEVRGEGGREEEEEAQHAPPLFVHANVLKHTGYAHRPGKTFVLVKRPEHDLLLGAPASSSSSSSSSRSLPALPLSSIRQAGLAAPGHGGICVDLWDAAAVGGGAGEQVEGASAGAYERGEVRVERWDEVWEGAGKGFEEMYYGEGGVAGAW